MEKTNKIEEFFKHLSELNLKRKQRIEVLNLIEVWNFLSEDKKQEFAERILELAEGYERSQIAENKQKECSKNGHAFEEWTKNSYGGQDIWYRNCKNCGYIERTKKCPLQNIVKTRRIFGIKKPF